MSQPDVRFRVIATTEDTDDPVLRAGVRGSLSYANIILDQENHILRVANVESNEKGHMKAILDTVVEQTGWTEVRFMVPISEYLIGDNLEDRLHGFEKTTERLPGPDGEVEVETLVGKWKR